MSLGNTTREKTLGRKNALPRPLRLLVSLVCRPTRLLGLVLIICLLFSLNPDTPRVLAEATTKQLNGKLARRVSSWSETVQQHVRRAFPKSKARPISVEERYTPERKGLELSKAIAIPSMAMMFTAAPSNLAPTAASETQVSLSWTAASGSIDHYRIERSTSVNGPFITIDNATATTSFNDSTVTEGTAYLYRVRAVDGSGVPSLASNVVFATAIAFADDPFPDPPTLTSIKAVHFTELRQAVDAVRELAGLSPASWTDPNLQGTWIKAVHLQQLRQNLTDALSLLNVSVGTYVDPTVTANETWIKRDHIQQLRSKAKFGVSSGSGTVDNWDLSVARLDPMNEVGGSGENPLSRNFNWALPLLGLPGRSGMNLGLSLSYNSLVWTKAGNTMFFDTDYGFPGPGFRLGFPVLQQFYYNSEVNQFAYMLIGTDGSRTELRQVGNSMLYEAADSSHLLLDSQSMTLRTTDGTQLSYAPIGSVFECTQIKDRNGNYLTINYDGSRLDTVVDTLGRTIKFNYDQGWLSSITQVWNENTPSQRTHTWASFAYDNLTIDTNFTGLTVAGPADNSSIKVLKKVTLADNSATPANNSYFDFAYTSWGQIWQVNSYAADNHLRSYSSYNLPQTGATAQTDCPRFTERHDWAEYWMGDVEGTPATNEEVITTFGAPSSLQTLTLPDGSQQTGKTVRITAPNDTYDELYFIGSAGTATGWSRGLPAAVFNYDDNDTLVRKTMTTWKQDNESVSYILNPRVEESKIYDGANTKKTTIGYTQITVGSSPTLTCMLPTVTREYDTNGTTVLRSNKTTYSTDNTYHSRRILGLPIRQELFAGDVTGTLMSKVELNYDESGSIDGTNAPIRHDSTNYGASFVAGRGNLTSTVRFDVSTSSQSTVSRLKYNRAGSLISQKDALNHEMTFSYTDSFSDGNNSRNTFAYGTVSANPDGFTSSSKYHYDFGAVTSKRTPLPNTTQNQAGPEATYSYDTIGRLERVINEVNDAYTRFEYPSSKKRVDVYTTIQENAGEAHSFEIKDGHNRTVASATQHPGSTGGYSGIKSVYDLMGRLIQSSKRTETSASGTHTGWSATGEDAGTGWVYTSQTYDWKGRPLITTQPSITANPGDTTTKEISYDGCGCAGGEIITLKDEGTVIGGILKRRQKRIHHDILGRVYKTESLNWDGNVDAAAVTTFNVRDQVTSVKSYAGVAGSATFQEATSTYDGYGRLKTQHRPNQVADAGNSATSDHTTWEYNADDTIDEVKDARGVITTFGYNNRHLVTSITYDSSSATNVTATSTVSYAYDAAGNRTSMTDGSGSKSYHYDDLSRMDWEERTFSAITSSPTYRLSYEYNLGGVLKKVTDEFADTSFTTSLDAIGRPTAVSGVGAQSTQSQFVSDIHYRATGALSEVSFGNGLDLSYDYNVRGMLTSYAVGTVAGATYQYYNNGLVRFSDSLTSLDANGIKDRAYKYDFAGRMEAAYSGAQARYFRDGTTGPDFDGPFYRTYSYDKWNNLIEDSGYYWTRETTTTSTFNTSNRNANWSYDAEGNLLSRNESGDPGMIAFVPAEFTYDAAGREVLKTQTRGYNLSVGVVHVYNNTKTYDGDGQMVVATLGHTITFGSNPPNSSSHPTYFLRSTVLGGKAISEYDENGWKVTHVFAGLERIAEQGKNTSGQAVNTWKHTDPVSGDTVNTSSNGTASGRTTLDPQGANMGDSDPYPSDGSGDPDGNPPASGFPAGRGTPATVPTAAGGARCSLDGILVDCGFIRSEATIQCPDNDCGPRKLTVTAHNAKGDVLASSTILVTQGQPGWDGSLDGSHPAGPGDAARIFGSANPAGTFLAEKSAGVPIFSYDEAEIYFYQKSRQKKQADRSNELPGEPLNDSIKDQCSITVKYKGPVSKGGLQFLDGGNTLGKTVTTGDWAMYSFRFEVSGWVNGTIGFVGPPGKGQETQGGGAWRVGQSVYGSMKAQYSKTGWTEIPDGDDTPGPLSRKIDSNTFTWNDWPGATASYKDKSNKLVELQYDGLFWAYVTDGKQTCAVGFRIRQTFRRGVFTSTISKP